METLEQIKARVEAAILGAKLKVLTNDSPCAQHSLHLDPAHAVDVARFLRDDSKLRLDYVSNMAGVDWPDAVIKTKIKKRVEKDGQDVDVEETIESLRSGYLEAVYHVYSMALKHGPVILRLRTEDRLDRISVPSLTPVWRGAEFQEREAYDLYGIQFTGHPDLRRILMWDEFTDYPMRKDYVEPDDYEYEPTPHDDVVEKARRHYAPEAKP
jgi:NADH-quinone oxidoreductase subunit C